MQVWPDLSFAQVTEAFEKITAGTMGGVQYHKTEFLGKPAIVSLTPTTMGPSIMEILRASGAKPSPAPASWRGAFNVTTWEPLVAGDEQGSGVIIHHYRVEKARLIEVGDFSEFENRQEEDLFLTDPRVIAEARQRFSRLFSL